MQPKVHETVDVIWAIKVKRALSHRLDVPVILFIF